MIQLIDIKKAFEYAHPIAGDTDRINKCITQLLKERDAYRQLAIELSEDWEQENTGKFGSKVKKECADNIDREVQKLLDSATEKPTKG